MKSYLSFEFNSRLLYCYQLSIDYGGKRCLLLLTLSTLLREPNGTLNEAQVQLWAVDVTSLSQVRMGQVRVFDFDFECAEGDEKCVKKVSAGVWCFWWSSNWRFRRWLCRKAANSQSNPTPTRKSSPKRTKSL